MPLEPDWDELHKKILDACEKGEVGSARNTCFHAHSLGTPPPALQETITRTIAFGNRNLFGLHALYDDNESMRANTDTVSPAVRLMREEFIDSWDIVLSNTLPAFGAAVADLDELNEYLELAGQSRRIHGAVADGSEGALGNVPATTTKSIAIVHAAIRANPNNGKAYVGLIQSLLQNERKTEAQKVISQIRSRLTIVEMVAPEFLLSMLVELFRRGPAHFPREFVDDVAETARAVYIRAAYTNETEITRLIKGVLVLIKAGGRNVDGELRKFLPSINVVNEDATIPTDPHYETVCAAASSVIRGALLGIAPDRELEWQNDNLNISRLSVARAKSLANQYQVRDALSESAAALNRYKITDFPPVQILVGQYKVIKNENLYYAVPRNVSDFRILGGRVIRVPAIAYQIRALLPQRLVRLVRRISNVLIARSLSDTVLAQPSVRRRLLLFALYLPIQVERMLYRIATSRPLKWAGRTVESVALMLITQKSVKVSPSLEDLLSEIRGE